ncbi:unnamed protein product, partial [Ectocarpus fasciculatus]
VAQVSGLFSREHRLRLLSVVHKDEVVAQSLVLGEGHELGGAHRDHGRCAASCCSCCSCCCSCHHRPPLESKGSSARGHHKSRGMVSAECKQRYRRRPHGVCIRG